MTRAGIARFNLSARAYHQTRSVKLARTITDLARSEKIQSVHLAEALPAITHALASSARVIPEAQRVGGQV